jgi:hypothetical protein
MVVGFTGTREGMTANQKEMVEELLTEFRADIFEPWFHHGNCIGADEQALEIAKRLGYKTMAHPTDMPNLQISVMYSDAWEQVEQPLKRNRDIVRKADVMIAAPKESEEPKSSRGSGTWFTIRHCRKQNVKRRCFIVWPNGKYTLEEYAA